MRAPAATLVATSVPQATNGSHKKLSTSSSLRRRHLSLLTAILTARLTPPAPVIAASSSSLSASILTANLTARLTPPAPVVVPSAPHSSLCAALQPSGVPHSWTRCCTGPVRPKMFCLNVLLECSLPKCSAKCSAKAFCQVFCQMFCRCCADNATTEGTVQND